MKVLLGRSVLPFAAAAQTLRYLSILYQEAECRKEMMDVKFQADTKMANSKRELELQKASFNQEVNTKVGALKSDPKHGSFQS